MRCIEGLSKLKLSGDEQIGVEIVKRALEEPIRTIANNAGQEGSVVVNKVRDMKTNEGYDADKDVYTDMIAAGVIDPKKVTRSALQNAASIASLMITTETIITDIPKRRRCRQECRAVCLRAEWAGCTKKSQEHRMQVRK